MRFLFLGQEPLERCDLLIVLARLESDAMKGALRAYLVNGISKSNACEAFGVLAPNFTVALSKLEKAAKIVERIKEIDYLHLR